VLLAAGVIAFVLVGMLLPAGPFPRFALLAPVAYSIAIVGNLATALILLAMVSAAPRPRLMLMLSAAFCANAVLLVGVMLVLPMLPNSEPVLITRPQFGPWLFFVWHALVAAGAATYLIARRLPVDGRRLTRLYLLVTGLCTAGVVCACVFIAAVMARSATIVSHGAYVGTANHSYVGPLIAIALGLAALALYLSRAATPIELGFALSLLCVFAGFADYLLGGPHFATQYYFARILVATGSLVVLDAAVRTLIVSRTQLSEAEWTLGRLEVESAKRAGRVRAVWEIVSLRETSETGRLNAILRIATAALRPGKPMVGVLSHQLGDVAFIDASASSQFEAGAQERIAAVIHPGASLPMANVMANRLERDGRSHAWDDLAVAGSPASYPGAAFKSFIGSRFEIAGQRSFLGFASSVTMSDEPFAEDDLAYVEVIASLLAARFEQQHQFDRIKFQIEHDELTGLENRVQFRTAVRAAIGAKVPFTVAFINLDGFRKVNERHGNPAGDAVLVEVAARLRRAAGVDLVARVSSDEFAVMMRDGLSAEPAATRLQRYRDLFHDPFRIGLEPGASSVTLSASIGAAGYPADGDSAEELIRRGGLALETAKARGGSVTLVFATSMEDLLEATRLRVVELRDGIANDELAMEYQPTFSIATRRVSGAEALVRWNHPGRGTIEPAQFVDFALRNGLIAALTRWVFARVSSDVLRTPRLPFGFRIYVNLAAPMLEDVSFIADVKAILGAQPFLAAHLGFEVTESAAMENIERSMNTIGLFRSWGLHVAIDDFGTGHSSLAYLKYLTVDLVKIDRSFIAGLPLDQGDGEVVDMLLQVINRFGFAALAEGIETEDQATWLLVHGCRFGQGFLVAQPRSFGELLERIGVPQALAPPGSAA